MTPREQVIQNLLSLGWEMDGETPTEIIRMGTARAPVYGGFGGEAKKFGGRPRLRYPGSVRFITVGQRNACCYTKERGQVTQAKSISTRDLSLVLLKELTKEAYLNAQLRLTAAGGQHPEERGQ